ncbi:methionine aminopeptidase [Heyndrickxia sporothermodurans]|uniref:methionine aminopeptidase n=1 Tax=Heyndrickxia sporothermodurans TaxID=46224 RepID=UPI000D33E389|nr:methionine aminopeptidase [Heyndrickxia sporothermodurans]PTY76650.1 methionine aminopeptidase [Heyndrickxia sporothermodurans]
MGIFNALSNWKTERYERHIEEMHDLGKCPDCRGRGFTLPLNAYAAVYECPGCNGSGLYSDWSEMNS